MACMSSECMTKTNPFDSCSEQYSKFRPDYPRELIEFIDGLCNGFLVDVGAGTGKASAAFLFRGVPVIAVEPSLPMIRQGILSYPGLRYVSSTAEQLPLASGCASTVICGQAFHWMDPARALPEFARVLKPGGHACLFWNTRDIRFPAAQAFEELIHKWNPEHVLAYRRGDWGERLHEAMLFESIEHRRYDQIVKMNVEDWVGLSRSISYIQAIGPERTPLFEDELRERLGDFLSVDCSYTTDLWSAAVKS